MVGIALALISMTLFLFLFRVFAGAIILILFVGIILNMFPQLRFYSGVDHLVARLIPASTAEKVTEIDQLRRKQKEKLVNQDLEKVRRWQEEHPGRKLPPQYQEIIDAAGKGMTVQEYRQEKAATVKKERAQQLKTLEAQRAAELRQIQAAAIERVEKQKQPQREVMASPQLKKNQSCIPAEAVFSFSPRFDGRGNYFRVPAGTWKIKEPRNTFQWVVLEHCSGGLCRFFPGMEGQLKHLAGKTFEISGGGEEIRIELPYHKMVRKLVLEKV